MMSWDVNVNQRACPSDRPVGVVDSATGIVLACLETVDLAKIFVQNEPTRDQHEQSAQVTSIAFHLPGKHDQDAHGHLRPGDIAGLAQPAVVKPTGHAPTVHNVKPGAKGVPAHVWHKNADGTVVAESSTHRIAWDEGLGKYIVQEKSGEGWKSTGEVLGKQAAYDKIKHGDWVQPHKQHDAVQTSKTLTPGKQPVAPPKTKAEMPSPGEATKHSTELPSSAKATISFEPDGTPALNAEQAAFVAETLKKHKAFTYSPVAKKFAAADEIAHKYPELSVADVAKYMDKHHNASTIPSHHTNDIKYYLKVTGHKELFGHPKVKAPTKGVGVAKKKVLPGKKTTKQPPIKKSGGTQKAPSSIFSPEASATETPGSAPGRVRNSKLFFERDEDAPLLSDAEAHKMHTEMLGPPPPDKALTAAQRSALKTYTGHGYLSMNSCLRHGIDCDQATKKQIAAAHLGMRRTTRTFTAVRGANFASLGTANPNNLVGKTITDKGFISTSINPSTGFKNQVRYQIKVPKGAHGIYAKPVSKYPTENEFILAPNTKFRVRSVKKKPDSDTWFVDLEVIVE